MAQTDKETPSSLSDDVVAEAHAAGAAAAAELATTLTEFKDLFVQGDQVEILARVGIRSTLALHRRTKAEQETNMQVFHVELLQALSLASPRSVDTVSPDFPKLTSDAMALVDRNRRAYQDLYKSRITAHPAENDRRELIDLVRNWTLAVRGERHPKQTRRYTADMANAVDTVFRNAYGCSAVAVVQTIENVVILTEKRLRALIETTRPWLKKASPKAMLEAYVANLEPEAALEVRTAVAPFADKLDHVKGYLWNRMEADYAPLLTFTFDELAPPHLKERNPLRSVLDSLSLSFGAMDDDALKHLHLDNPVRLQPLIQLDNGCYFCPCPPIVGLGLSEIFQALCNRVPKVAKRLESARAEWLEQRLEALVAEYLPQADLRRSVSWIDTDGVRWESDVVAVIDKTVLAFEAKSGKVSPPARRGAENSLKNDLDKLVGDASVQSARLKALLEAASAPIPFETATGPWMIDPAEVRDIVRVNVLLDTIGPLSSHWPRLMACGLLRTSDMAPSMSLFELETVFEVLTLQRERCHYLSRRAELERTSTYIADELDLLALYLDTQFNLGDKEHSKTPLELYGWSDKLAHAYASSYETPKFPIRRRPLWSRLLNTLESQCPQGWTRFGHRLLNVNYQGQVKFERMVESGWKKIRHKPPETFFTSGLTTGLPDRPEAIGFCIGSSDPILFQDALHHGTLSATGPANLDDALMIYWFRPKSDHGKAYDFIGTMRHASMDDILMGKFRPSTIALAS